MDYFDLNSILVKLGGSDIGAKVKRIINIEGKKLTLPSQFQI